MATRRRRHHADRDDRRHDHDGHDRAVAAETQRRFVAEDARRQRQQARDHADGDGTKRHAFRACGNEGPKRHDPGAHAVEFEAVHAVAEHVSERGAVAEHFGIKGTLRALGIDRASVFVTNGRFCKCPICPWYGHFLHRNYKIPAGLASPRARRPLCYRHPAGAMIPGLAGQL